MDREERQLSIIIAVAALVFVVGLTVTIRTKPECPEGSVASYGTHIGWICTIKPLEKHR